MCVYILLDSWVKTNTFRKEIELRKELTMIPDAICCSLNAPGVITNTLPIGNGQKREHQHSQRNYYKHLKCIAGESKISPFRNAEADDDEDDGSRF